jgi:hypothetical protein
VTVDHPTVAFEHLLDDALAVDGVQQRLADKLVAELRTVDQRSHQEDARG